MGTRGGNRQPHCDATAPLAPSQHATLLHHPALSSQPQAPPFLECLCVSGEGGIREGGINPVPPLSTVWLSGGGGGKTLEPAN